MAALASYPIGLGTGALVSVAAGAVAQSFKANSVWVVLSAVGFGLITLGLALIVVQVWIIPWLDGRIARDPLKILADKADDLANKIMQTYDVLVASPQQPTPALRTFESELGAPLHNMYHDLRARKLVKDSERDLFYVHTQFAKWATAAERLREVAEEARNRAYGT